MSTTSLIFLIHIGFKLFCKHESWNDTSDISKYM